MTKNEYLVDLAVKLQKLTNEPGAIYPELKSLIAFYQEMLDDKIEDGMTEEEAVAAMESADEIVARLKAEFTADAEAAAQAPETGGAQVSAKYDDASTAIRREYSGDSVKKVVVRDSGHALRIIRGERIAVNYKNSPEGHYEVSCANGELYIEYIEEKRGFFRIFAGRRQVGELALELPAGWENGVVDASTKNAPITARDVGVGPKGEMTLRTSNGRVTLENISPNMLTAVSSNGVIDAQNVTGTELTFKSSNGSVNAGCVTGTHVRFATSNASLKLDDITGTQVDAHTSNGPIRLRNVVSVNVDAATSNSGISVDNIVANDISLVTSNGGISGALPGKQSDYAITSRTSNSSNNLPNGTDGGIKLDVRTSNGKIAVDFAE